MLGCDDGIHGTRSGRDGLGPNGVVVVGVEPGAGGDELSSNRSSSLRMIFMWFMLHMLM